MKQKTYSTETEKYFAPKMLEFDILSKKYYDLQVKTCSNVFLNVLRTETWLAKTFIYACMSKAHPNFRQGNDKLPVFEAAMRQVLV